MINKTLASRPQPKANPASVMDMSFANQGYSVPEDIDREIARIKLREIGINIDILTPEQLEYLNSLEEGT